MSNHKLAWVMIVLVSAAFQSLGVAQAEDSPSMEEMVNKANNPLSGVWLLIVENDTTLLGGNQVPATKL